MLVAATLVVLVVEVQGDHCKKTDGEKNVVRGRKNMLSENWFLTFTLFSF